MGRARARNWDAFNRNFFQVVISVRYINGPDGRKPIIWRQSRRHGALICRACCARRRSNCDAVAPFPRCFSFLRCKFLHQIRWFSRLCALHQIRWFSTNQKRISESVCVKRVHVDKPRTSVGRISSDDSPFDASTLRDAARLTKT